MEEESQLDASTGQEDNSENVFTEQIVDTGNGANLSVGKKNRKNTTKEEPPSKNANKNEEEMEAQSSETTGEETIDSEGEEKASTCKNESSHTENGDQLSFLDIKSVSELEERVDVLEKRIEEEEQVAEVRLKHVQDEITSACEELDRVRSKINEERQIWKDEKAKDLELIAREREEISNQQGMLSAQEDAITERMVHLQNRERDLEESDERNASRAKRRTEILDQEVEARIADRIKTLESIAQSKEEENDRLRESLQTQEDLLASYSQLERELGGKNPEKVLLDLNSKTEEIRTLREELATRPTDELQVRYEDLEREKKDWLNTEKKLRRDIEKNSKAANEIYELKRTVRELEADRDSIRKTSEMYEKESEFAQIQLNKVTEELTRVYGSPAGEDERRAEIEMPYISKQNAMRPRSQKNVPDEIEWLDGIYQCCEDYGLHFNKRLLNAFHTSLKTAEWAPLTVLAGVSGTGKSELPRLYAHFGGLYFASVSVQPNWDSQESMLGFFNSIDNRFDAQPILNFLAQTQKEWSDGEDGYPGLSDAINLVLLDEMNLAHPELYFAEFLSKLELRRGSERSQVPKLDVKIGSGMNPYKLPLGRNVLWVGTMNQDETTKSLSDKVLDRSIVINFPRPAELKRRTKLKPLTKENRGEILSKHTWGNWCKLESVFDDDEVRPYKNFVEKMNNYLGEIGRAIGHRVWQSVEFYMSNYPDILKAQQEDDESAKLNAMHTAFEDQIVQKMMPKLRGIDTQGVSKTKCLDGIREQLSIGIDGKPFNLLTDFDQACELGYGQFIWQSANYLEEEVSL